MNKSNQALSLVQLIAYNAVWLISIIIASKEQIWQGVALSLVFIICQIIACYYSCINMRALLAFAFQMTLLGFAIDSALFYYGVFAFSANPYPVKISPPFLSCIWLSFSIMFYSLLRAFSTRFFIMSICAGFGLPLAYYLGAKLGAAVPIHGLYSLLILGLIWLIAFPGFLYFYTLWSPNDN